MTEIRCKKCNRLLMKVSKVSDSIEIKCPKCGYLQAFLEKDFEWRKAQTPIKSRLAAI
jgi:phage FluMu protein Com